jgi:hypothetical protein
MANSLGASCHSPSFIINTVPKLQLIARDNSARRLRKVLFEVLVSIT